MAGKIGDVTHCHSSRLAEERHSNRLIYGITLLLPMVHRTIVDL